MDTNQVAEYMSTRLSNMIDQPTTIYENQELPATPPYLLFESVSTVAEFISLGRAHILEGLIQITVITRDGVGVLESERIADRVIDCFPVDLNYQGLTLKAPPQSLPGYPDGGLWRKPVQIRWRVLPV